MTSGKSIVLVLFATTLLACAGESFVNTGGEGGTGAAGQGAGGQGGAGAGGSAAGSGGSNAGQGGSNISGSGGSDAGSGGSDAGSGGSGGSSAGAGGSGAGQGGSDAGAGGSDAGQGGSDAGQGGSSGGAAGQGGSSGAGGAPPSCLTGGLQCKASEYCNADTGACVPCGDMNRFEFGEVEALQAGTNFAQRSFPRVEFAGETLRMHFRIKQGNQSAEKFNIARVDPPYEGGTVEPCCINKGDVDDSGPLPLPSTITAEQLQSFAPKVGNPPSGTRFFLLDSKRGYEQFGLNLPEGPRRIFLASQTGQPNDDYYEPIQKLNGGLNNYSVAYAYSGNNPRFYWIRDTPPIGGGNLSVAGLYTMLALDASSNPTKVPVKLEGCEGEAVGEDLAPWVFPNGNHLLFHARCTMGEPLALYHAALAPTGIFQGPAKKIPVDWSGAKPKNLRTPSLSPDRCDLFFEGDNTIYRAKRR